MNFVCNDRDTVVQTTCGKLKGYRYGDVYTFKGIPYATAKRFQPPVPVDPWDGILDALCYGHTCPLLFPETVNGRLEVITPHRFWPQGEDCQNLNIWTGSITHGVRKPVVVWLHGGGFFAGSAVEMPAYDGYNLCKAEDLVVVTVNHRLNVLGYLDLRKFGAEYERSVNAGNLDLVAALQWIHDNIASFGGDPDNVTIFGQSGGGGKVLSLMNTPSARGLFRKGLVMSGTLAGLLGEDDIDMSAVVRKTICLLGGTGEEISVLEKAEYADLAKAYSEAYRQVTGKPGFPFFAPMVNSDYPGNATKRGLTPQFLEVPLMIGSTFAEFASERLETDGLSDDQIQAILIEKFGEDRTAKLLNSFRCAFPALPLWTLYHADAAVFRSSSKDLVQMRVKANAAPTYLYFFTTCFLMDDGIMAWHCADIPYFFHNVDLVPGENLGEAGDRLEKAISGAFAEFARTGVPKSPLLPDWKPCDVVHEYTMLLDLNPTLKDHFDTEFLKTVKQYSLVKGPFPELEES